MILSAFFSYTTFYSQDNLFVWGAVFIALLYVSYIMYTTLVYYTGAVPSEYYTLQKRPNYKEYQEQTNQFFPGPQKLINKKTH